MASVLYAWEFGANLGQKVASQPRQDHPVAARGLGGRPLFQDARNFPAHGLVRIRAELFQRRSQAGTNRAQDA